MVDQVADRVKFDKEEDIKPLAITFRRIFEPMTKAMKDIALIPKEVSRIVDVLTKDIKSGQPDRFVSGSKKSADSVDMIQMMKDFTERNSEEGKKRQQDLADLERIAQERQKAEADIQKLRELGTPAEITEDNKVKILNEKEIIDRQKEYIKEQKEVTKIEKQIALEQDKGEDADADRLVMLKESLDKQNELLQKQGEVLGDRLPRQKVSEAVTARDFVPGPLMEAYDNIAESANESARAIGGIFQPLIGLKKVFTQKEEYEDEYLKEQKDNNKKQGLAVVLTTLKFAALAVTLAVFIKSIYDLGKMLGFFKKPEDNLKRKPGETQQQQQNRLVTDEGMNYEEAGVKSREGQKAFDFVPRLFGLGGKLDELEEKKVYKDRMKDVNKTLENAGLLNQSDFTKREKPGDTNIITKGGDTLNQIKTDINAPRASTRQDLIDSASD